MSLAKVTFIKSEKNYVVADYVVVWQHAATQPHSPQRRTFFPI